MADEDNPKLPEQPATSAARENTQTQIAGRRRRASGGTAALTRRAIAFGLLLVAFVAAFAPYNDYILRNSPFIGNHFPISVVFIIVALILLWNPVLRSLEHRPRMASLVIGAALSAGVFFVLHASECVPSLLQWIGHLMPAAGQWGNRLAQHPAQLLLVNVCLAPLPLLALCTIPAMRRRMGVLRVPLAPGELAVIMTMMLIGAAVPTSGLMRYLEPMVVTPYWHQRQTSYYKEVTDLMPAWLVPSTNPTDPVVANYWLGVDPVRGGRVPVVPYLLPALLWGVLIAALLGSGMFLAAIFRRQWVHHERLTFPLATIPLELMSAPEAGRRFNALWRNPVLWTGAAIPLFVYLLAGLHRLYPAVPQIDLHFDQSQSFSNRPWDALPKYLVDARLYFAVVGICFFIPSEVAFSLWLFVVLNGFLQVAFSRTRFDPSRHENTRAMGIYVAYFMGLLWLARGHLKMVLTAAWKKAPRAADEPLSYRTMVAGWLLCIAVAWIWLIIVGMNWLMALLLLGIGAMLLTLMSRIVAETGLFWVGPTFWPKELFLTLLGPGVAGTRSFFWTEMTSAFFYGDLRENIMPYTSNSLRMTQDLKQPDGARGKWFRWLGAALLTSMLISGAVNHYLSYTHGRANMDTDVSTGVSDRMLKETHGFAESAPDEGFLTSWCHFGAGSALALGLMIGRAATAAWPFHPIGLVLMNSGPMHTLWFSIFIGWGIKQLLMHYGGAGAFRRARPFFIGLIVGEIFAAGAWMFIGLLTHGTVTFEVLPK